MCFCKNKIWIVVFIIHLVINGCFINDPYPEHIKFKNNEAGLSNSQQQVMLKKIDSLLNKQYINQTGITSKLSNLKNAFSDSTALLATDFAQKVTLILKDAFDDKHLSLYYDTALVNRLIYEQRRGSNWNDIKYFEAYSEHEDLVKNHNFDFSKLEILPGNVGYLKFDYFAKVTNAQQTIDAAMQFLNNCDALIIDLQENAGGHVNTAEYICSFFYPHACSLVILNDAFVLQLPFSEITGPVTKNNWEAKGIEPDITKAILKSIEAKFRDDEIQLIDYEGNYGRHKFELKNGVLYHSKIGRSPVKLLHIKKDEFVLQNKKFETVFFNRTKRGNVYAVNFIKAVGDTLSYLIDEEDFSK